MMYSPFHEHRSLLAVATFCRQQLHAFSVITFATHYSEIFFNGRFLENVCFTSCLCCRDCSPTTPFAPGRDDESARRLWDVSLDLVGLTGYDPLAPDAVLDAVHAALPAWPLPLAGGPQRPAQSEITPGQTELELIANHTTLH